MSSNNTNDINNKNIEQNLEASKQNNRLENKNNLNKRKEKESILSETSNENDNEQIFGNENEKNNNSKKDESGQNLNSKGIIDINEPKDITNKIDNRFDDEFKKNNLNENEENISRSMSSNHSEQSSKNNSFNSRSRSRSNSIKRNQNQNYNGFIDNENRTKNFGNKFQNYNNINRRNRNNNNNNIDNNNFIIKNGCCRDCMKAFSKNGKSCLCQVPRKERKFHLPDNGCNYCGCKGCNPIDVKYNERMAQKSILFKDKGINHKNQRILDSDDENLKIKDDDVDYYNMEKKEIQEDLNDVLKINSIFYGFGVPLRTPSYILGYNPNINYFFEKRNNINNNVNNNYSDYNNNNNTNNINNFNISNNLNNNNNNKFRRNNFINDNLNNNNRNMNFNFNRNPRFRK